MADYYGSSRSNFFRVKDMKEFLDWLDDTPCAVLDTVEKDGKHYVSIQGDEYGRMPKDTYWEDETGEESGDFIKKFSGHLEEGSTVVLMEAGAENLRYITGWALAFDSNGNCERMDLNNIYEIAEKKMGGEITVAEFDKVKEYTFEMNNSTPIERRWEHVNEFYGDS